jgi:rod shape-determining protein MreC
MKTRGARRIIIALALGLLVVSAAQLGFLRAVQAGVGRVTDPVGRFFWQIGTGVADGFRLLPVVKDLATRNAQLEHEVAELKQRLAEDAEIRNQNETLKKQLGFTEIVPQKLIPAEIIAFQPDNFRAFLTIGRGKRDGVIVGRPVISEGLLVGRVVEVSEVSSKVQLVIDPDFKAAVVDQSNESRATGTVHGQIGRGLYMEKIPQDQQVLVGDTIVTSGLGGDLPKGLVIGQVESVTGGANIVFQTAQLTSPLKFHQLELVFVLGNER